MRFLEVDAAKRFTNVHFDPQLENVGQISIGYYGCPNCESQVYFKTSDFQRHLFSEKSNLPLEIQQYLSQHRPLMAAKGESFLDFLCDGCSLAIRVIYEPWEFRMGNYGFDIKSVIEIQA